MPPRSNGDVLNDLGVKEWKALKYTTAQRAFERAVEIPGAHVLSAIRNLSDCMEEHGQLDEALVQRHRHLALARTANADVEISRALTSIGNTLAAVAALEKFDSDAAGRRELLNEALQSHHGALEVALSSPSVLRGEKLQIQCRSEHNMGLVRESLGQLPEALEHYTKALHITNSMVATDFTMKITTLAALGAVQQQLGTPAHLAAAASSFALLADAARAVGDTLSLVEALLGAGEVALATLAAARAKGVFRKAYKLARAQKQTEDMRALRRRAAAGVRRARRNVAIQAEVTLTSQRLSAARDSGSWLEAAHLAEMLGDLFCTLDSAAARDHAAASYQEVLSLAHEHDLAAVSVAPIHSSLAITFAENGNYTAALAHFEHELKLHAAGANNFEISLTRLKMAKVHNERKDLAPCSDEERAAAAENVLLHCLSSRAFARFARQSPGPLTTARQVVEHQINLEGFLRDFCDAQGQGTESSKCCRNLEALEAELLVLGHDVAPQHGVQGMASSDGRESDTDTATSVDLTASENEERTEALVANTVRIKRGQNLNRKNEKGETRLQRAAIENQLDTVRRLIDLGADPHTRDNCGWTPLHEACNYGHTDIVALLLQQPTVRINDTGPGHTGRLTPLHDAVINKHFDVCQMLVAAGAQLDLKTEEGMTPLDFAIQADNEEIFLFLQKACIDQGVAAPTGSIQDVRAARNIGCVAGTFVAGTSDSEESACSDDKFLGHAPISADLVSLNLPLLGSQPRILGAVAAAAARARLLIGDSDTDTDSGADADADAFEVGAPRRRARVLTLEEIAAAHVKTYAGPLVPARHPTGPSGVSAVAALPPAKAGAAARASRDLRWDLVDDDDSDSVSSALSDASVAPSAPSRAADFAAFDDDGAASDLHEFPRRKKSRAGVRSVKTRQLEGDVQRPRTNVHELKRKANDNDNDNVDTTVGRSEQSAFGIKRPRAVGADALDDTFIATTPLPSPSFRVDTAPETCEILPQDRVSSAVVEGVLPMTIMVSFCDTFVKFSLDVLSMEMTFHDFKAKVRSRYDEIYGVVPDIRRFVGREGATLPDGTRVRQALFPDCAVAVVAAGFSATSWPQRWTTIVAAGTAAPAPQLLDACARRDAVLHRVPLLVSGQALTSVLFSGVGLRAPYWQWLFQSLMHAPTLQRIDLSENQLCDADVDAFFTLAFALPQLVHLNFSANALTIKSFRALCCLKGPLSVADVPLQSLKELDLSFNCFNGLLGSDIAKFLQKFLLLSTLRLESCFIDDALWDNVMVAKAQREHACLTYVVWGGPSEGLGAAPPTAPAHNFCAVSALATATLCDKHVSGEWLQNCLPRTAVLTLINCQLLAGPVLQLAQLPRLQELKLNNCITGARLVADVVSHTPALQVLSLMGCAVSAGFAHLVHALKECKRLTVLDLAACGLESDVVGDLLRLVVDSQALRQLDVSHNLFCVLPGATGLAHPSTAAAVARAGHLTTFDVTGITDERLIEVLQQAWRSSHPATAAPFDSPLDCCFRADLSATDAAELFAGFFDDENDSQDRTAGSQGQVWSTAHRANDLFDDRFV